MQTKNTFESSTNETTTRSRGPRIGPYVFGKTLGQGYSGTIKLAKNLQTGQLVAVKIIPRQYLIDDPVRVELLRQEISILSLLSHPNIISLLDVFEIDTHIFLVTEHVQGEDLLDYLGRHGPLTVEKAMSIFQQIISALEHCQHLLICHRDIKLENIMIDEHSNVKIIDFGLACLTRPGARLSFRCGSPFYIDPVVMCGQLYDGRMADIYSCGIVLFAMLTARVPFAGDDDETLHRNVMKGKFEIPNHIPQDVQELIRRMITVKQEHRITLEKIKQHRAFPNPVIQQNDRQACFTVPFQIDQPKSSIVQRLVDLGWGSTRLVLGGLKTAKVTIEQVLYHQISMHPLFG